MTVLLCEMHLWSLKNTLHVEDQDIGVHHYYDKKESEPQLNFDHLHQKQLLAESRDYPWVLKNKRPEKLRDTLKELEELMQNSQCVLCKWKTKYVCQLLFHSGILVSLSLCGPQLERVVIDRTLMGKLISDTISDAVLTDSFMILTFWEQCKLCFIQFTKKANSPDVNKRPEKLSSLEYKISYVDIPGPGLGSKRLKRHLAVNSVQDMVICWWSSTKVEMWPWTPASSERERANLLLLKHERGNLEILSYIRTSGDPLDVTFSSSHPHQIRTVEHSLSADQEPMADSCIYECVRDKVQCVAVTKIPLVSKAISCCRNITEDKLVLGCEDSSIVLYEDYRQLTLLVQAEVLPTFMCCHPNGAVVLVGSSQGELQMFDIALSPIKLQLLAEDFSPKSTLQFSEHFNVSSSLSQIQWAASQVSYETMGGTDIHNLLLLRFHKGPIGVLHFKTGVIPRGHFGLMAMIQEYIHQDEIHEAINILSGMNWNTMGEQCFVSLSAIVNYLLRQKLTGEREAQLEATLGTFYVPRRPLAETTVLEYRDQISRYARRFFHHLLRHQRFEKAFLLAIDIGAHDLFMDIHYFALDKDELALAEVAKKKANDIDTESITTAAEIPGHKGGEDALSEAFADLSVLPQREPKCPSNLPLSTMNTRSFPFTAHNSSTRSTFSREIDTKEHSFIRQIYTTLQMNKDEACCETETSEEAHDKEEIRESNSVKVVHFGLV